MNTEVTRIMTNATNEANRMLKALNGIPGPGADLRRLQVGLSKLNVEMWGSVGDATKVGIGDAVWGATEAQSLFDESMFTGAGNPTPAWWRATDDDVGEFNQLTTAGWVDWYNHRRVHGSLGMISPVEYEEAHYAARQAVGSTTMEAAEIP